MKIMSNFTHNDPTLGPTQTSTHWSMNEVRSACSVENHSALKNRPGHVPHVLSGGSLFMGNSGKKQNHSNQKPIKCGQGPGPRDSGKGLQKGARAPSGQQQRLCRGRAAGRAAFVKAQSPVHLKLGNFIVYKFYLEKADSPQNQLLLFYVV